MDDFRNDTPGLLMIFNEGIVLLDNKINEYFVTSSLKKKEFYEIMKKVVRGRHLKATHWYLRIGTASSVLKI